MSDLTISKDYGLDAVEVIKDDVDDLSRWSTFNDDVVNEDIALLNETLRVIKSKIKDLSD